jgi:hypothetical protein
MSCWSPFLAAFRKDVAAKLDYLLDWSEWISLGDTIVESTWERDEGIAIDQTFLDATTNQTAVILSGGSASKVYRVANRVVTQHGRIDRRTILIGVYQQANLVP